MCFAFILYVANDFAYMSEVDIKSCSVNFKN